MVHVLLRVDDKIWDEFKGMTPSNITLEEAVIRLIEREVETLRKRT